MAKTSHTRNGKVRKHTNRTAGSHMNGKKIDSKMNRLNPLLKLK